MGKRELGLKNDFEFINGQRESVTLSLVKEEVAITPVVHYDTLHWEGSIIGYMVFQDFIDAAKEEIDKTFAYFRAAGIQELIIDLRYNGGGSVPVAEYLSGWLMGSRHSGKPLVKFIHNKNNHQYDTTVSIPANENSVDLDRIFFIGTQGTASASELIINGVKPYVQSILAGEPTHGKPVGMYGIYLQSADYVILPVSFRYTNGEGEGDFYNGLVPDLPVPDDITRDFGDKDEDCLESVLHYISTGVGSYTGKKTTQRLRQLIPQDAMGEYLKAF
jgi:C-terminal processing protease CtpA/Prc